MSAVSEISEIDRLERREWELVTLAILAILWLTLGMLMTPLPQWLGFGDFSVAAEGKFYLYYLGLVILILALCGYLIISHRKIRGLRSRILNARREIQEIVLDLEGLRSLHKVTASISSQMDIAPLLRMIAREAVTTLGAHQSSLMLLDDSRTELRTVATWGTEMEEVRRARVRLGEGVAGWVAQHGKPLLLHGRLSPGEFHRFIPKERPITSAVCVPLKMGRRTIGVLNVNLLETDRQFNENELRLLNIYANHAAVAIRNAALLRETQEKARMRAILEGWVSPQVVDTLMRDPRGWMEVGEVRELTVLFADIRGFTRVVDEIGASNTRVFLNQVFTRMSEILFEHQGTLDKFIGDSVMAFFGAPLKVDSPALRAVEAGRSMIFSFHDIQREWEGKIPPPASLSLGVGISTGQLFIGNVGSPKRFDYTVIGQAVNVAKRLCDQARGGQILVSESTRRVLPKEFPLRQLEGVKLKGLDSAPQIFEVVQELHVAT